MSRTFTTVDENGNELKLKFIPPSQKVLNKAELVSRSAYSSAWRQGCLTVAEVKQQMKERGLWGDEQEEQIRLMREKIAKLEDRLREDKSLSNEEGEAICDEISRLRDRVVETNDIHRSVTINSCESIADEERNKFLVVNCIVHADTGESVYKDVEDFMSKVSQKMGSDSFNETLIGIMEAQLGQKLSSDLSEEYVENKWRAERKRLEEVQPEAEEGEKKPKKSGRKKTS